MGVDHIDSGELAKLVRRMDRLEKATPMNSSSIGEGGVRLYGGGSVNVEGGGGMVINDGGGVDVKDNGQVTVEDGGTVRVDGTTPIIMGTTSLGIARVRFGEADSAATPAIWGAAGGVIMTSGLPGPWVECIPSKISLGGGPVFMTGLRAVTAAVAGGGGYTPLMSGPGGEIFQVT